MYVHTRDWWLYVHKLFCAVWYSSATSNLYSRVTCMSLAFTFLLLTSHMHVLRLFFIVHTINSFAIDVPHIPYILFAY